MKALCIDRTWPGQTASGGTGVQTGVQTGATHCNACPAGQFSEAANASCADCGVGLYSAAVGATNASACSVCPAGRFPVATPTAEEFSMAMDGRHHSVQVHIAGGNSSGTLRMNVDGQGWGNLCVSPSFPQFQSVKVL